MDDNPDQKDRKPLDLRREQRGVYRGAIAALIVCALVLPGGFIVLPRMFDFPVDLQARLVFWAQSQVFVLIWIVIGIGMVARGRRHSAADISGSAFSPPSPRIAIRVAFLQNTLEQAVIASGAYLALATLLSGDGLALIISAILLFGVGRVTFLAGYARGAPGRAFGFVLTVVPTLAGYGLAIAMIVRALLS